MLRQQPVSAECAGKQQYRIIANLSRYVASQAHLWLWTYTQKSYCFAGLKQHQYAGQLANQRRFQIPSANRCPSHGGPYPCCHLHSTAGCLTSIASIVQLNRPSSDTSVAVAASSVIASQCEAAAKYCISSTCFPSDTFLRYHSCVHHRPRLHSATEAASAGLYHPEHATCATRLSFCSCGNTS